MSGYVEIPLETMKTFLEAQGFIMHKRDANTEHVANKIFTVEGINYVVRVYTSINPDDKSRSVGKDAIRVCVYLGSDGSWVFGTKRVNRTKNWQKSILSRIEELEGRLVKMHETPKCDTA